MALLTPKDIREHTFQTVRFKEGYDVDEVDDFLDQVTETVEALGKQAVAGGQSTQALGPDVSALNKESGQAVSGLDLGKLAEGAADQGRRRARCRRTGDGADRPGESGRTGCTGAAQGSRVEQSGAFHSE